MQYSKLSKSQTTKIRSLHKKVNIACHQLSIAKHQARVTQSYNTVNTCRLIVLCKTRRVKNNTRNEIVTGFVIRVLVRVMSLICTI